MGVDLLLCCALLSIRYMALATADFEPYYTTINTDFFTVPLKKEKEGEERRQQLDLWSVLFQCVSTVFTGGRLDVAIINCLDRSLDLCVCGLSHWPKEMTVETFRPFSLS